MKANILNRGLAAIALTMLTFAGINSAVAQVTLTNGWTSAGTISPAGNSNSWTFSANVGDSIVIRVGAITQTNSFTARIRLRNPSAVQIASASSTVEAEVAVTATNNGTFTVIVDDANGTGTGTYRLTLAKSPGAISVAPGDEGGPMTNGVMHTGTMDVGDLDVWTFTANSGDNLVVRMGKTVSGSSFIPYLRLYGPDGALLGSTSVSGSVPEAEVSARATNSGTFTVVAANNQFYFLGGNGTYRLTLAKTGSPVLVSAGDEGGPMTNGVMHTGTMDVGDLDVWTFTANSGDNLVVRMGRIVSGSSFIPYLRLYGPDGALLGSTSVSGSVPEAEVSARATNSGTFTVVAANNQFYFLGGNGTYRLTLAKTGSPVLVSAGDEGGPMTNGVMHTGTMDVGDLDVWTFTANSGDNLVVRMGRIVSGSSFIPYLRLYGPDGALLGSTSVSGSVPEAEVSARATNSGTFTVVAANNQFYFLGGNGTYRLTLAKTGSPVLVSAGDEGGPMTNGVMHTGTMDVGDLDVWTFTANSGDNLVVRMGKTVSGSSLIPYLRLYGPDGALLGSTVGSGNVPEVEVSARATNSGTFTVVAANNQFYFLGGNGTYRLTLAKTGSPIVVSAGDEGGSMTGASNYNGTIDVGDLDPWSFTACSGDNLVVGMSRTSGTTLVPYLRLYGPNGVELRTTSGSGNVSAVQVNAVATNSGAFIVVAANNQIYSTGGNGTYTLTVNGLSDGFKLCIPVIAGTNFYLGGIGGASNATYILKTSTNITTPLTNWTPIRTNQFDAFGVFTYSNLFNRAERQRYFRLFEP